MDSWGTHCREGPGRLLHPPPLGKKGDSPTLLGDSSTSNCAHWERAREGWSLEDTSLSVPHSHGVDVPATFSIKIFWLKGSSDFFLVGLPLSLLTPTQRRHHQTQTHQPQQQRGRGGPESHQPQP